MSEVHGTIEQPLLVLPLLPLRGMMAFPNMVLHFDVGRKKSIQALERATQDDPRVFLVAQRDGDQDNPGMEDLYEAGTIARVKQILKLPGDNVRVLVEGLQRATLCDIMEDGACNLARVCPVEPGWTADIVEMVALVRTARQFFTEYAKVSGRITGEAQQAVGKVEEAGHLADIIATHTLTRLEDRQHILACYDVDARLNDLCAMLVRETELAGVEKLVQARVKKQVEKNQKEYYLREQIKAIQSELGDRESTDTEELRQRAASLPLGEEARERVEREMQRLSRMTPGSPEIGVSRTYIEWILDLPWGVRTTDDFDLRRARRILDEDHHGMTQVKDRVVEYLAVRHIKQDMKGPILCLVGPPGVGKTSIARSVARSLGRKFVQMSLGGVRDEAEIRGHRRTYIGAIPGRILSALKQAGTENPVFLFDEIDKMSSDFRGDPASAMLEVLDAEQNHAFRDHYLELPYDLSRVLFLTTANTTDTIPRPLLDRMELIQLSGYTEEEKLHIAKRHLLPKQIKEHGLAPNAVKLDARILRSVISGYTREAGVRQLERTLGKVVRKAAVRMLDEGAQQTVIHAAQLEKDLGAVRYRYEKAGKKPEIGVVNGLAYTAFGGDTLQIETSIMPGKGALELTGQLGDVMQESARTAKTWVRAHAEDLGIPADFYEHTDIHIHVPEGAVPKDGPSAGVTIASALTSALTGIPVRQNVAMTGEITLRGRVLPIGGLKEKLLAAHRAGVDTVLIPQENVKDLEEVPEKIREHLHVLPVSHIGEVLRVALTRPPEASHGD